MSLRTMGFESSRNTPRRCQSSSSTSWWCGVICQLPRATSSLRSDRGRMPGSQGGSALWLAVRPQAWPAAPNELSVSSLGEIEACPRRWALASADYPELWDRPGYPPRLFIASLKGSVVHLALETVTKALARAGCRSVQDADAVQVMRGLGGYTKLISDCIQRALNRFADNPRAAPMLEIALRSL